MATVATRTAIPEPKNTWHRKIPVQSQAFLARMKDVPKRLGKASAAVNAVEYVQLSTIEK